MTRRDTAVLVEDSQVQNGNLAAKITLDAKLAERNDAKLEAEHIEELKTNVVKPASTPHLSVICTRASSDLDDDGDDPSNDSRASEVRAYMNLQRQPTNFGLLAQMDDLRFESGCLHIALIGEDNYSFLEILRGENPEGLEEVLLKGEVERIRRSGTKVIWYFFHSHHSEVLDWWRLNLLGLFVMNVIILMTRDLSEPHLKIIETCTYRRIPYVIVTPINSFEEIHDEVLNKYELKSKFYSDLGKRHRSTTSDAREATMQAFRTLHICHRESHIRPKVYFICRQSLFRWVINGTEIGSPLDEREFMEDLNVLAEGHDVDHDFTKPDARPYDYTSPS